MTQGTGWFRLSLPALLLVLAGCGTINVESPQDGAAVPKTDISVLIKSTGKIREAKPRLWLNNTDISNGLTFQSQSGQNYTWQTTVPSANINYGPNTLKTKATVANIWALSYRADDDISNFTVRHSEVTEACASNSDCTSGRCHERVCRRQPQPPNGTCDINAECVAGSDCVQRTCKVRLGQACTADNQCGSNRCYNLKCIQPKADGQTCNAPAECQSNVCINMRCTSKKPNGARCVTNSECHSAHCIDNFCSDLRQNGQACRAHSDCRSNRCIDNTCSDLRREGGSCLTKDDCVSPLECIQLICRQKSAESGPCDNNSHCQAGLICSSARRCERLLDNGRPCVSNQQCRSGYCLNGACGDLGQEGARCQSQANCAPGYYCSGSLVCTMKKVDFSSCMYPHECRSNKCENGQCKP